MRKNPKIEIELTIIAQKFNYFIPKADEIINKNFEMLLMST